VSLVIDDEIIELDGSDPAKTILPLTRERLEDMNRGRPQRAEIAVHGAIVYVTRNGDDPSLATKNYESYGNGAKIIVDGYDNMVKVLFGQLDSLTSTLSVVYIN